MAQIGIAIIGGGIFVKEEHLPAALSSPLLSIKAIWSRSLKSAQDTANLIPGDYPTPVDLYSTDSGEGKSYDDLLKRADIRGVIIALPIPDQSAYTEKALAAGKHVLAEKPIAKDVASALKLIEYYKKVSGENGATLAIAENFRFTDGYTHGAEEVKNLGRVTAFIVRINFLMKQSNKYYQTAWRQKPEFQGGFILDAGVHFTAALRKLLGEGNTVESVIAQTSLTSSYLPQVDSINAVLKLKSGAVGSFVVSFGNLMQAFEFHVACEQGVVKAESNKVVVTRGADESATTEEKAWERTSGVKNEVQAWAEGLASGKPNPAQSPEQALADLELLEKMLKSGDNDGARQVLAFQ